MGVEVAVGEGFTVGEGGSVGVDVRTSISETFGVAVCTRARASVSVGGRGVNVKVGVGVGERIPKSAARALPGKEGLAI